MATLQTICFGSESEQLQWAECISFVHSHYFRKFLIILQEIYLFLTFFFFVPPLIAKNQLQYVISGAHDDVSTCFSFPFILYVVNMAKYGQILPINH